MTELAGRTPSQTVGPYLSIGLLRGDLDGHVVDPEDARAVRIRGRLLDGGGDPVPDGLIETWQADAEGRYRTESAPADGFVGFGRSATAADGAFEIVTLKPGRAASPDGGLQAPHLVVGVFARGLLKRAATRLYFPDEEEANDADPVLTRLDPARRRTLIADDAGDHLSFDIRLQGPRQTTFFAL